MLSICRGTDSEEAKGMLTYTQRAARDQAWVLHAFRVGRCLILHNHPNSALPTQHICTTLHNGTRGIFERC